MTSRNTVKRRRELGICRCGNPAQEGRLTCRPCVEKIIASAKNRRHKRAAKFLCRCGSSRRSNRTSCEDCSKRNRSDCKKKQERNKAKGFCQCGKPKSIGNFSCPSCRKRRQDLRSRKRAAGICTECNDPATQDTDYCEVHKEKTRSRHAAKTVENRKRVLAHYGNKCKCCGEDTYEFLTFDHINNDGAEHRNELLATPGMKGYAFDTVGFILANNFPDYFQILCWNCNLAKAKHKVCPHERARAEQQTYPSGPS